MTNLYLSKTSTTTKIRVLLHGLLLQSTTKTLVFLLITYSYQGHLTFIKYFYLFALPCILHTISCNTTTTITAY
ncbi:hypothetical protein AQUCO_04000125v1 [Aquilegia coerulea]|uniref:Uncharacterized protein n=1 Tax=Aquilegia coerulea TaxID=218851 RepID=A0A2G5CRA6_AQUCA|nr:hypothetical protein AQUCO_04000125v1 [Aquilegia coerulea]